MADIGRKMVEIAESAVSSVPPKEVHERIKTGESLTILDVREPDEWADGVIEGATLLARGRIESRLEDAVPDKDAAIVIH